LKLLGYFGMLLFLFLPVVRAQVSPHFEQPIATPLRILSLPDSVIHIFNEDSAAAKMAFSSDTVRRPGKSTTVALLASMVIPGAGQIYNGSYWKAPVIWGVGYYFISVYNQQNKLYQQYRVAYTASIDSADTGGDPNILKNRNFYHNQRDTFAWYLAIEYVVNLLDAYVDASLYNFEVSPNLQPTTEMRASLRIPL
jgi:Family of unknown function (DUF5683)